MSRNKARTSPLDTSESEATLGGQIKAEVEEKGDGVRENVRPLRRGKADDTSEEQSQSAKKIGK